MCGLAGCWSRWDTGSRLNDGGLGQVGTGLETVKTRTHAGGGFLQSQEQRIWWRDRDEIRINARVRVGARSISTMYVRMYIQQQRSLAAHFWGCQPVSSDHTSPRIDDWAPTVAWELTKSRGRPFADRNRAKEQVFRTVLCCIDGEKTTGDTHGRQVTFCTMRWAGARARNALAEKRGRYCRIEGAAQTR